MKTDKAHALPTALALAVLAASCTMPATGTDAGATGPGIPYGKGRLVCHLADRSIDESSGLAASRRQAGVFWTHDDSGAGPDVHAFDLGGRNLGVWRLRGAVNRDWEDMASYTLDGNHWLLLADVGDNARRCKSSRLYFALEPTVDPNRPAKARPGGRPAPPARGKVEMTVDFFYDNGCQDCEAVAVDPNTRTIILIAKRGKRVVYQMPLPDRTPKAPLTARTIGTLSLGWVSAMDISPDGRRALVATYGHLVEYARSPGESWQAAFARKGRVIPAPGRKQGEAACYDREGGTIYLTSEGTPCPLFEVPPRGGK